MFVDAGRQNDLGLLEAHVLPASREVECQSVLVSDDLSIFFPLGKNLEHFSTTPKPLNKRVKTMNLVGVSRAMLLVSSTLVH